VISGWRGGTIRDVEVEDTWKLQKISEAEKYLVTSVICEMSELPTGDTYSLRSLPISIVAVAHLRHRLGHLVH